MGKTPTTLLEVCVAAAGGRWRDVPKGYKAASFVIEWAWASYDGHDGEWIATPDFAAYWKITERHAWRRRKGFHDVFEGRDPNDFAAPLIRSWQQRKARSIDGLDVSFPIDRRELGLAA